MPPTESQQQGQVPAATAGQTPAEQSQGQVPAGGQADGQVDLKSLPESVQAYIAGLRGEAANHRTAAQAAAAKVTEYERANETAEQTRERERVELQAERDRLRDENRNLHVTQALKDVVGEAKAINPAMVISLLQSQVALDKDGKPTNLEDLVTGLRQSDPYLFRRTAAGAGAGSTEGESPKTGASLNDFIRGRTAASR